MIPLAVWEQIIDASGVAARIEALLPAGVRRRQQPIWAAGTLTSLQVPIWRPGDALVSVRR